METRGWIFYLAPPEHLDLLRGRVPPQTAAQVMRRRMRALREDQLQLARLLRQRSQATPRWASEVGRTPTWEVRRTVALEG